MISITQTIPLLSVLPHDVIQRQIDDGQLYIKNYYKSATLNNQKETCETLDIVLSGTFVTYSLAENGSAMQIFEFKNGQMLGANLLFGGNSIYPLSVYCANDGEIMHITKSAIADFLHYYDFAMIFIAMLSQNSQRLNKKMRMRLHKTLRKNLLEYFDNQSRLQQTNAIILPISKKQLADTLGVQRPSLFRELKIMKDSGIISVEGRFIKLNYRTKQ